ncbi:recombinase family protein [Halococcus hamelinensis]|uniref:recombinase family protein n=1 Tax=Halococcus hamelinensis TaxID=332168 RepID=UPI0009A170A4|nr:recombinase family protein [Halococcus hamelinensis]
MCRATILYIRTAVSSQEDAKRVQRRQAVTYATETLGIAPRGLRILRDSGTEARNDDSSSYQRLLDLVTNGKISRVIVTDAARLGKNVHDLHRIVTEFTDNGVAVHVIDVGLQVGESEFGAASRTPAETLEMAKDLEMSIKSGRTKDGVVLAQEQGSHIGRPPFGFDSDGNGGLVPNENFETALEVIERIKTGSSKRSTAKRAGTTRSTVSNIIKQKRLYLDTETQSKGHTE